MPPSSALQRGQVWRVSRALGGSNSKAQTRNVNLTGHLSDIEYFSLEPELESKAIGKRNNLLNGMTLFYINVKGITIHNSSF